MRGWCKYLVLACVGCLTSCDTLDRSLVITVSTEEPAPSIAAAMKLLLEARGFSVTIRPDTDAGNIVASVRDRSVDLAIVEEPLRAIPGVVALTPLYPNVLHVLYRGRPPPTAFAKVIREQNVYAGPVGGAAYRLLMRLAGDFGVASDEFTVLDNPWTDEPDVYFIFGGLLSEDSLRQLHGYRLYSFGDVEDLGRGSIAEGIVLKYPGTRSFVLPESIYYALGDEPVVTLAVRSVLITHSMLDSKLAYEIVSQLFENAQAFVSSYPLITQELNASFDPTDLTLPLHPGTRRYIDKDDPSLVERYAEVIGLSLTILAILGSGILWIYNYRKNMRKDRIDVFYNRILDLRNQLNGQENSSDLNNTESEVKRVQHDVFELLVDERVDADAALIIFLNLSNQVLSELEARRV